MKFVGIDLHTNRFTCCYLSDNSKEKQTETFNLDTEGLRSFYSTINKDTYVLVEATINTFAFVTLFKDLVKEVIIANTYQLKSVGVPGKKTDKLDAAKLAEKLKAEIISGVQQIVAVTIPPKEIRDLRALFATYRALRKEIGQTKNRIHSLLKENLYPFTKEYIFGKKARKEIRIISNDFLFAKSGLIPRSSAAAEMKQRFGAFGIKQDVLINFLTERASVPIQRNAKDTAELCSAEAH